MSDRDQMSQANPEIPESLQGKRRLGPEDEICFACHSGLTCFNTCCHDVNVLLTPVDVLKLSRRLGLTTTEFLTNHTLKPITKELKLPVVMLRMSDTAEKACPFVGESGCTVYEDRPWPCRMYPVAMAVPPARAGVEPQPLFFLLEDDFCKGHQEKATWTVESWRQDQGVLAHEDLEAGFRELHSHPWFIGGTRHLNPAGMEMFFLASFDLDTFRKFIFDSTFLQRFELENQLAEKLRGDDEELLRFGSRWLRYALFGETTIKVREGAPQVRRKR